eukprot:2933088-Prymnesium_polylepis.1
MSESSGGPSLAAAAAYSCARIGPSSTASSDWTLFHVSNSSRQEFQATTDLSLGPAWTKAAIFEDA